MPSARVFRNKGYFGRPNSRGSLSLKLYTGTQNEAPKWEKRTWGDPSFKKNKKKIKKEGKKRKSGSVVVVLLTVQRAQLGSPLLKRRKNRSTFKASAAKVFGVLRAQLQGNLIRIKCLEHIS